MARNITLTLGAGLGADLGPNFNLTADVGSVTPSTGTKSELTAGKSVSVDDAATGVTITSTGTCTNAITQTIPCAVTTSTTSTTEPPTTTTTTTAAAVVDIYINTISSLDIPITGMTINGVAVTWSGAGPDFTLAAGDNGQFTSTQAGTQNVVISYGSHTSGQRIIFTDSNSVATCQTLNGGSGTFTITGATITLGTTISVYAEDGICA